VFIAAGAFAVTPRRKALVNFTMPISIQTSTLLTARPGEVSRTLIFMAPFTYGVSERNLTNLFNRSSTVNTSTIITVIIVRT
jgi:hypothetical protein